LGVAAGGSACRSIATKAREPAWFRTGKDADAPIRAMLEGKIKEAE
jgi:hypothetical protein